MTDYEDENIFQGFSACCTEPVYRAGICPRCHEHCEVVKDND